MFFQKGSFFQKRSSLKNIRIKNGRKLLFRKRSFSKTIVIRFLKVQNEWVAFKKRSFIPKTKRLFLKTIEKRSKKLSFNDRFQNARYGIHACKFKHKTGEYI